MTCCATCAPRVGCCRSTITAIGGSDDHAARSLRGRIGRPTTVVWARELSEAALLEGLRTERAYIRTRRDVPAVDLEATSAGQQAAMGGTLAVSGAAPVVLRVTASGAAGQVAEFVRNGAIATSRPVETSPATVSYSVAANPGDWVNVRLRDATGVTVISNPIYIR